MPVLLINLTCQLQPLMNSSQISDTTARRCQIQNQLHPSHTCFNHSKMQSNHRESWTLIIQPKTRWWDLKLNDLWQYRDLLLLLVRRDFVAGYTQTVLGPLWFFIQPVLTTVMFTLVFSGIAGISTDGIPPMLFYLAGTTPWNYFAGCFLSVSNTFVSNSSIFGKVYFPRLIVPLATTASHLMQFLIQFLLMFLAIVWFYFSGWHADINIALVLLLTPALVLLMAMLALGAGMAVSSLTTKYRDLGRLVSFGMQLWMYATPIIYPLSAVPKKLSLVFMLNPMSAIVESFRAVYLGGSVPWIPLMYSSVAIVAIFIAGILLFNRIEKTFMDSV